MTKEYIKSVLPLVFETKARADEEEYTCFASRFLNSTATTDDKAIYEAVSGAMFESGLTHSFSYEIASRAVDILAELEDWDATDQWQEMVDGAVPVYTNELMQVYAANSWAVDEAREDYGTSGDSTKEAAMAWYMLIERMVVAIEGNLAELITV